MDHVEDAPDGRALERLMEVPEALRTDHWYNDLQHAMLVILFRHMLIGIRSGIPRRTETLMTVSTLYLWVHFADEEEGIAWWLARDLVPAEEVQAHCRQHRLFLDHWRDRILAPYRSGELDDAELYARVADYYDRVLKHIERTDQYTYGRESALKGRSRSSIAHVALSGLPLSPFMAGAMQVVQIDDPAVAALLDRRSLAPMALHRMEPVALEQGVRMMLPDGRGLRDGLLAALPRRPIAPAADEAGEAAGARRRLNAAAVADMGDLRTLLVA